MRLALALLILFSAAPAHADFEIWDIVSMQARQRKGAGFAGWMDLQARRKENNTQVIVRPAVGYALNSDVILYAGYAWIPTIPDMGDTTTENRLWQQARWLPQTTDVKFEVRPRLEERWLVNDDQVAFRARLLARGQWTPAGQKFYLALWDELFINLNDTEQTQRGFDQNRLFAGAGIGTTLHDLRVEGGYMNIWASDDKPNSHVIAINLVVSIVLGE